MTVLRAAYAIPGRCEFQAGTFLHLPKWHSQNGRIEMEMAEAPHLSLKIHTLLISQSVFGKPQSAMLRFIIFSLKLLRRQKGILLIKCNEQAHKDCIKICCGLVASKF